MFPPNTPTPDPGATPPVPEGQQPNAQNNPPTRDEINKISSYVRKLTETFDSVKSGMPTLDTFVSLGLLEKAADGSYKPKAVQAPAAQPQQNNNAEPEWKQAVEGLKKSLKAKDDELAAERQRAADGERKNAVISALAKAGAVNPDRDAVHILAGIQRNDQGQYISRSKDDLGLDVEIGLEDFVGKFLHQNPELKKATGHAGSGTPTGANASGAKTVSRDQLSPEFYAKNREKIMSGEIQLV